MSIYLLTPLIILTTLMLSTTPTQALTQGGWASKPQWSNTQTSKIAQEELSPTDAPTPFAPRSHNFSVNIGQVFLMGDLSKYANAIGFKGNYTYGVSELFNFDSSIGYSEHSEDQFSLLNARGGLRINLSWYDKIIPYGLFGVGFYKPSYEDHSHPKATLKNYVSTILFGIHLGAGVDLELSRNFFFGTSLVYHNMFRADKKKADGSSLSVGGAFTSFVAQFGVTF